MPRKRFIRRLLAGVISAGLVLLGQSALPAAAAGGGPDLAAGAPATASTSHAEYGVANVTDGNQNTYWQSAGSSFPQWVQVDLGSSTSVGQVVVRLPAAWEARDETFSVQGSPDGSTFATLSGSAARSFGPGSGNTITIDFAATPARFVRLDITANTGWPAAQVSELEVHGSATSTDNLAQGRTLTASSGNAPYVAANAGDGSQGTYWESTGGSFPQWIQADLGSSVAVTRVVLKLPPSWEARTQTLSLRGSTNGSSFSDLVASRDYAFRPTDNNTVTIDLSSTTTRYLRVDVTGNTGWAAAQLSELEVYGPATGDTTAPNAPTGLAYTEPGSGRIRLTWSAAGDNVGVTGYDVYANGELRTSVSGSTLTYTDDQPDSATVSYFVRAKDAAGNVSGNSNTVTRAGSGGDTQAPSQPGNLTLSRPGSGQIKLNWTASSDNVGVTGYEVYANEVLRATVPGSTLTYTDSQPDTATVSYHVRAKDAAGNRSVASATVTRNGSGGGGSNMAVGKPITASSSTQDFVAANANDNSLTTYWEGAGGSYPNTLTVSLGANTDVTSLVLRLNPDSAWGTRTQTVEVLGREQGASGFSGLKAAAAYTFSPSSGNSVSIPVGARVADVRLRFTANSGAGAGQVAEFQVIGTPAPNPDLTVTGMSVSPSAPVETDVVSLSATVRNLGELASGATNVTFYLGTTKVGTAAVGALAAGASTTVTADIGGRNAGSYPLSAKVDESGDVIEQNDTNNAYDSPTPLVVKPVDSSDLIASPTGWSPGNPAKGSTVAFSVAIRNQGTVASAAGSHGITVTVTDTASGSVVRTLTGSYSGAIGAGSTTAPVALGTWTATDGKYTVRTVIAPDANELAVKRQNNTSTQSLFVGRGADMPYDMYEAEDGVLGGGAAVVGPNRTVGDLAGEASGRKAVTLNGTGSSVEFTTRASTNTLVVRYSIPDAAGGGGIDSTLNVYVDGSFLKAIDLTSRYAWLYGSETAPGNNPGEGSPRHIYDEANMMLGTTVPAGAKIKLQKDAANGSRYAIDFVNTEQVSPIANPDPAAYTAPTGFTHQDVQNALDKARMDSTGTLKGVYLPPGDYETGSKFQVYGKPVRIIGAGPWYARFHTPAGQSNTDAGFRADSTAGGSVFSGFSFFGNYTSRIDGPGKVFDFANVADMTIDNVWNEHTVCLYWGANTDNVTIKNSRIRDTFADGVNMTNGSTDNHLDNIEDRATGDDSFALFSAIDAGGADEKNNLYENLTSLLTWRAAGVAVYGGYANTFRNILVADTLVYSGVTISSLDFGYPMNGFGTEPTNFQNISIIRCGGHFWGSQTFPGIWLFSASKAFQGIRVSDVDIVDPTYSGIMFQTNYVGGQPQNPIKDTILTDVSITGAHRSGDAYDAKSGFGLWANEMPESGQGPAVGSVTFDNLTMSDNHENIRNTTSTFTINVNP